MRDIFICHAGEDKEEVVRPMTEAFAQAGISCWYDEAEIKWGDSVTSKVNEGLATSKYVIVVFSSAFLKKNWPQRELNAVLNQEASTNEVKVLPLLVGSEEDKRNVLERYPLLNDKRYLPWDGNLRSIVDALLLRLKPGINSLPNRGSVASSTLGMRIPLPKIKKQFSERDKDLFLQNSFNVVRDYFKNALQEIERQYQEVETNFAEVHNFKFLSTIYIRGEVANRCKIWIGGLGDFNAICYQSGQIDIERDVSYNEMLTVSDNKISLGFRTSLLWSAGQPDDRDKLLNVEQAAELLWRSFTQNLE